MADGQVDGGGDAPATPTSGVESEAGPSDKNAQAPAANPLSRKLQRVLGGTGGGTVGPLDPEVCVCVCVCVFCVDECVLLSVCAHVRS